MPAYCYILVAAAGAVVWFLPFVLTGWNTSKPLRVNHGARWGLGLQAVSYALIFQGSFWAYPGIGRVAASVACLMLAGLLSWTATRALGRHLRFDAAIGADHELVQHGPYRFVRHPIYTSMLCMLWGIGFMIASPWVFVIATVVFLAGTEIRTRVEDGLLLAQYGESFEQFRRSTRAYIPLLR